MVNREYLDRVTKLTADNPTKYIKIRDIFEEVFEGREPGSANDISDIKYKRICARFQDIDVPFSWCCSKEEVYQLCKAIADYRDKKRREENTTVKKTQKSKKKGLFGLFK
ncbi:MAG TPA: hypothetical protein DF613_17075 [Lachnospiraceae bacterium]|nr:hypothetical protein [Lachnospiraceae bacterium]